MSDRLALRPLFDVALGLLVGIVGLGRIVSLYYSDPTVPVLIAVGMGVAVGLYRRAPAVALALVWFTAILQVLAGLDIALVQLAAVVVAYGTSRYGTPPTVIVSVISIPLGGVAAVFYAAFAGTSIVQDSGLWQLLNLVTRATNLGIYDTPTGLLVGFILVAALLAGPWALGLVLRLREQSRRAAAERQSAEAETARAQQLAGVRAEQARLARDVHDVVGHSLAVIVAQADSTQAMPDTDIARIRGAMANIAETARRSLGDVRAVLSDDPSAAGTRTADDLDSLIDGVRNGGTEVRLTVEGTERPLPPELEVVAYRTLQELLTNALKHGSAGGPIMVELGWGVDELRITTSNLPAASPGPGGGSGLNGVRDRLTAVGGTLEAGLTDGLWTATAHVPVRREGLPE